MPLTEYHQTRRFGQTPKPKGRVRQGRSPLRFVVQHHAASRLHYDFRLELDGVLVSWAVPKGPSLDPKDKRLAIKVEDHPLEYGEFEGTIPAGNYGAGTVVIWDRGTYTATGEADPARAQERLREGLAKGRLDLVLAGEKLQGGFQLIRTRAGKEKNAWILIKAGGEPGSLEPMLATLVDAPFDREGWIFEIKWDGNRVIAQVEPDQARLLSRGGKDCTRLYRPVADDLRRLGRSAVLDGEMVILDLKGRSDFGALQRYPESGEGDLAYMVFDCLRLDGRDLTALPLLQRRAALKPLVHGMAHVSFSEAVERDGIACFRSAQSRGLEGVMAKDGASPYLPGRRSRSWLKIKVHGRQEAVIGGYTEGRGARKHLGSLVLGVYEGSHLRFIGHTGSGLDEPTRAALAKTLAPLEQPACPFADAFRTNAPVHWVKPLLVCEVKFQEWTAEGRLRQPVFLGLRIDKAPRAVVRESPQPAEADAPSPGSRSGPFKIAHPGKVLWPALDLTKGDLARYYETVSPLLLPHLRDRPQSLHRFPDGIAAPGFYQKNLQRHPDWIRTLLLPAITVKRNINHLVCDSLDALLYMVHLGCIDLNPWHSRAGSLDRPDYLLLDLDAKTADFAAILEVAAEARRMLDQWRLPSYPKTSGKTGIHICLPLGARYRFDQSRQLAELLMNRLHQRLPRLTSVERDPARRQGLVYLDFLQNHRGKTMAAPYCVRPVPAATVSTPLDWSEVKPGLDPALFTLRSAPGRFQRVGDLWAPVLGPGIDLPVVLAGLQGPE
jgi:bifunctional non-homologous end joining protein LigD